MFQEYPKFKYSATNGAVIVNNADEEALLDKRTWKDVPRDGFDPYDIVRLEEVGGGK